jgi:hypothetical protein
VAQGASIKEEVMKIFHASMSLRTLREYCKLFPNKKINVLRSFGMLDHDVYNMCTKYRHLIDGLIFDSGTWTLNNASPAAIKHITLKNYKSYLSFVKNYFDFYFNFDSNFTADGFEVNYLNQLTLEKSGFTPVPVVHDIEGDEIQTYIDRGYNRVALGSSQIKTVSDLGKVMEKFEGTEIKVHLFGNTRFDLLANFPINSCDTAMWARTGGYGYISYWNLKKEGKNKMDKIYMEEYMQDNQEKGHLFSIYEYREDLEQFMHETFGITHYDLKGKNGAYCKYIVNTHYFVQLEEIITQIHKEKGFPTNL